ncbi:uncharacterized protein I303_107566 [Kwoniella dejecticola CBS 10117]|uniref:Uncharacterized protein n=1 Tax=Kwoniella dejecticola CBS 10117 TaxID=1296121 RepID=A0A1A5ZV33_9TREE|nr:uncharacterized protein I303_07576 [Kwoniella dejecticola CBS 10117]OBR81666.1 hypothetical protein I303_07576 [Kwoniella dejecticola CBS 10117]
MKFFGLAFFLVSLFASLVAADNFANFFSDTECNEDGSIGFDMTNPGCFAQAGRRSVYIPNAAFNDQYCLVITYDDKTCGCQNRGYVFTATGFCAVLEEGIQSYRFISGSCASNNC